MQQDLFPPGAASSTRAYAQRLWDLRFFIRERARARLTARNQGMILGSLWLLLEPFLLVMVYYVLFEIILDASRGVENFFLFLTVGRLVFGNHQQAVLGSAQTLADNPAAIRDSSLPKAALPLGASLGALYQWRIELVVMLAVAISVGAFPRWSWLLIPALSAAIFVLNCGIGLLLAPLVASFADIKRALPVLYRLLFYSSGIIFPIEGYVDELENANFYWVVLMANPIYGYIKAMQWAVFGYDIGHPIIATLVSIGFTLILLPLGIYRFARRERQVGAFRYQVAG